MRDKTEQLEWEARAGRIAGVAAWIAAAIIVVALVYRIAVLPHGAANVREFLPQVQAHKGEFLVSGIVTGLGMLAFILPLLYLYEVTRYRRPETPPIARYLIIIGPILFAIASVWFQFQQGHAADQFLAGTVKTNKHAEDVLRSATTAVASLSLIASLTTGLATILVNRHAMRAGVLSRFMGVLGMVLGALFVLPLIASPIIQLFWLIALGALFMNMWPRGRGPAWETGEATPWPPAHERWPQAPGRDDAEAEDEPTPALEAGDGGPRTQVNPRASRKRKRKSRR